MGPGMEADAAWREEAAERINRYRKRDLSLTALDAAGYPVEDAVVKLTQVKRACSIGSFTGYSLLEGGEDSRQLLDKYTRLGDRATIPIYWADGGSSALAYGRRVSSFRSRDARPGHRVR